MKAHLIPVVFFLVLSITILYSTTHFSSAATVFPTSFSFVGQVISPLRASLYGVSHAQERGSSEMDKLRAENTKLLSKMVDYNNLKKDNEALRSQFQSTAISSQKLLPAHIVGFKGSLTSPDVFILSVGTRSNIKKGMAVVSGNNLVGEIKNVSPYFSEVILVQNSNFSTLGVTSENNSPGIVKGEEDFIIFDHVVITDTISKNETVTTKGEQNGSGVGIPAGLIIGKITDVNKSETQPFQSGIVKSLVNFQKLSTVFVVTQ